MPLAPRWPPVRPRWYSSDAMKLLFIPVSLGGSVAAGALARWLFSEIWESLAAAAGLPERWSLRERAGMVLGAAVVLGPLALAALGLFGWLLMIAALTAYAVARRGDRVARRRGGNGPWALPRP